MKSQLDRDQMMVSNRYDTHKRGIDKSKAKATVAQPRRISNEDITDEVDGIVADPVKSVAGRVSCRAFESRKDDDADDIDTKEQEPGFGASPKVERLRNGKLQHTTNDGTENASGTDRRQRRLLSQSDLSCLQLDGARER